MKQQTVNKFAHLQYEVLHNLEITIPEYWYLDMVYQLSRNGYCYKSLENIANDMRMTVSGVVKMRNRLTEKGLIITKRGNKVSTSVNYNSVLLVDKKTYNSVHQSYNSVPLGIALSATKNNKEVNKDNRELKSSAKERIRKAREIGSWSLLKA